MIRIVYMGTPDFAVEPLEAIIKAGYEVAAVVTQPDKQKGRGTLQQHIAGIKSLIHLHDGNAALLFSV